MVAQIKKSHIYNKFIETAEFFGSLCYIIIEHNIKITNMKQIKVFKGKINGEVFDNVHSYNTRMTELISKGVTNIEATSSTSIKMA